MTGEHDNSQSDKRGVMTGGRLLEMILVTLASAAISGGIVAYGTLQVLQNDINHLRESLSETRAEIKQLRRDLYRPYSRDQQHWGGSVKISDLKTRLSDSLHDSGQVLADPDLDRCIRVALRAMATDKRPRRLTAPLTLAAGVAEYDAPSGLVAIDRLVWTNKHARTPWHNKYPGPVPLPELLRQSTGDKIVLSPPPDQRQVDALGGTVDLRYRALHETTGTGVDEEVTTLDPADEDLLILRAQAEACRELAMRNIAKPVNIRGGSLSEPRNATPAALYRELLAEWRAAP